MKSIIITAVLSAVTSYITTWLYLDQRVPLIRIWKFKFQWSLPCWYIDWLAWCLSYNSVFGTGHRWTFIGFEVWWRK